MQTVRRIYIYLIVAVSLGALAVGLGNLLRLALEQLWGPPALHVTGNLVREQLSLNIALTLVALPFWVVHWWLAERALSQPGAAGEEERRSAVRAAYLTLGLAIPFSIGVSAGWQILSRLFGVLLGAPVPERSNLPGLIATLTVATAVWLFHVRVRQRDMAAGSLDGAEGWLPDENLTARAASSASGAAAWLPRLYLYGASAAGAVMILFATASLFRLMVDVALSPAPLVETGRWWAPRLAGLLAWLVLGLSIWVAHWAYSTRLLTLPDWRGLSERRSALRQIYRYLLIAGVVLGTVIYASDALAALLRALFGGPVEPGAASFAQQFLAPLLAVLPFALSWWYHAGQARDEARRYGDAGTQATARRLTGYVVAFVALAVAAVGLAYVLGVLLDLLLGGPRTTVFHTPDWWRGQVATFTGDLLAGAAVWLWAWYGIERHRATDPAAEQAATPRRAYLYLVLAGALVALLGSVAFALYRLLAVLLGAISSDRLVSDISTAVGVLIVAGALAAYHGLTLRREAPELPATARPATLPLIITAPPGTDLDAVLADLRQHLPEQVTLRAVRGRE